MQYSNTALETTALAMYDPNLPVLFSISLLIKYCSNNPIVGVGATCPIY